MAGPYEFLPDDPFSYGRHAEGASKNSMPPLKQARAALAVHNILRVDAGWLSPKSARWFKDGTGALPTGFHLVDGLPVSRLVDSPIGKLGLVFFPEGPTPGKGPSPEQTAACLEAGKQLKKSCALLIGISPWGYVGERDFLPQAQGVFNCLFGGGEGVGFAFSIPEKTPGLLWIRPDSQGRAVNVLELYKTPQNNEPWKEGTHFEAWLEFLDDSFASDPDVLRIVGSPPE